MATEKQTMDSISFGILTVCDTCYHDSSKDVNGPEAARSVTNRETETGSILKGVISCMSIVPDKKSRIMEILIEWSDKNRVNVILTFGGTEDVMEGIIRCIIEKEGPGIDVAMLNESLKVTPMSTVVRTIYGVRGQTLIIHLHGLPKAVKERLTAIAKVIPHAVATILNDKSRVTKYHSKVRDTEISDDHAIERQKLAIILEGILNRLPSYPMISLDEAQAIMERETTPVPNQPHDTEVVSVESSHGRILAIEVKSPCNLPPSRISIKDGYAVISKDGVGPRRVLSGVEAGHKPGSGRLSTGECVRVSKGAPIPDGATAVIHVVHTRPLFNGSTKEESAIEILEAPMQGQGIRCRKQEGENVLNMHMKIGRGEMGILAACGVTEVHVTKVPVVGILSTGDVPQAFGESPTPGHVYDGNKITLMAALKECGYDSIDLGIVEDDLKAMIAGIKKALGIVDVLITSGSVLIRDDDVLQLVLIRIFKATIHFGCVDVKPGKLTTFATCKYNGKIKYFLCLPGDPDSAIVTAHLFAIPLLNHLTLNRSRPRIISVSTTTRYSLNPSPEYVPAWINYRSDDIPYLHTIGVHNNYMCSGMLTPMHADALLILPGKPKEQPILKARDGPSFAMLL